MYFFYNVLLFLLLPFFPFFLIYKELKGKKYFLTFKERFFPDCKIEKDKREKILIHGVSVGEIITIEPLVKLILDGKKYRVIISTITSTGYITANKKFSEYGIDVLYFPYDFPFSVKKFLKNIDIQKVVIAETELWPNFLKITKKMGCEIYIVNGRISEKSFGKYKLFKRFFKKVLENIDFIFVKSPEDGERFRTLGYENKRIEVVGNMKFDAAIMEQTENSTLGNIKDKLDGDFTLIFGSVMEGEEKPLIELFHNLFKINKNVSLIFAPRHLERVSLIEKILKNFDISYFKRSSIYTVDERKKVMILDTFGELKYIYSIGDLILIGGSLLPYGGHNPLEPLLWRKPVITGPHMENFMEIFEILKKENGLIVVNSIEELRLKMSQLLKNRNELEEFGRRGYLLLAKNRGVSEKICKRILES